MAIYPKLTKDGKIKKNNKGIKLYYFRDYYTDIYGKKHQYKSGLYAGKNVVEDAEREWLKNISNKDTNDANIDFMSVYNEWLSFVQKQRKDSTYYGIETRCNKYIQSFFKDYKLHYIKMNSINKWYDKLDDYPISIDYKNTIIGYLRDFLGYCRDNYDFDNKIVGRIIKYREDAPKDKLKDSEINFWCHDEWKEFIPFVDDYEDMVMYNFFYYTGLRFGEFDALNWTDYDPIGKTIKVTKNLSNKVKGKKFVITDPKSKNSVRIVDLDDNLNNLLIEYKKYKIQRSYSFSEKDFIFGDINYVAGTTFRRRLDNYISKVQKVREDFKRITPHGFRHSHVSLLIDLGCDSRDVAERIGDTVRTVEETYYHMFPKKKKITIDKLNNLEK